MVTPQEAELLASSAIEQYLNQCQPADINDIRRATIKLLSMAALALVASAGKETAFEIFHETAQNAMTTEVAMRFEAVQTH